MEKIIFVITLFFIASIPFYSHAVPVTSKKKSIHQPVNFSKKQKKRNFFQRIILRKIQRKLDRKTRKKRKRGNELANKSLGFGLGSILVLGFELLVGTLLPVGLDSGLLFMLLLGFNLTAFLFGIKGVSNGIQHLRKNRNDSSIQGKKKGDWKTSIGIIFGAIGVLTSAVTFIFGLLLLSYFG